MKAVHATSGRCDHCEAMIEHQGEPRVQRARRLTIERRADRLLVVIAKAAVARSFYRTIVPYRPKDY